MRTNVSTNLIIEYPDNQTYSGDLNNIRIIRRNNTVVKCSLEFNINGYEYREELLFYSSQINFSLSEIFNLIFERKNDREFTTVKSFSFIIRAWSSLTILETNNLSFQGIILGKRRVFDKKGIVPVITGQDYAPQQGVTQLQSNFTSANLKFNFNNGTTVNTGLINGVNTIDLKAVNDIYDSRGGIRSVFFDSGKFEPKFDLTFQEVTKTTIKEDCSGSGYKLGIRFLNRFGLWRYYYVMVKAEVIGSEKGISIWFNRDNPTELNSLYNEQKKKYSQSITVYKEDVTKSVVNDFSDIIYTDYVHIFDEVNQNWIPVRVQTNTFSISEKESTYDVNLNIMLQKEDE